MTDRRKIYKGLALAGWFVLGTGVLVLLVAAVQTRSTKPCAGMEIVINDAAGHLFVDKTEVAQLLRSANLGEVKGKAVKDFDLKKLEETLEHNPWISNAEIFFDNDRMLQVRVEERQPLARIFTQQGGSYYIDSTLKHLPLDDRFTPRLPVFTGFPTEKAELKGKDSLLMADVARLASFIRQDTFWMAQVDQVDINARREFDLMPKVGDHVVRFGDGEDIEGKFDRLMRFYEQVLSRTGWNTYGLVNVQYRGQVVATRRDRKSSPTDTAQVRNWMKQWQQNAQRTLQADTLNRAHAAAAVTGSSDAGSAHPVKTGTSTTVPATVNTKPSVQKAAAPNVNKTPKAVMPPPAKQ
jgi:cell division protein FtsQ